jgi:hypothetical protein
MKDTFLYIDNHHSLVFYIILLICLVLTRIPVAGKYFRGVNTLIHEAGHAFMTLLVSGEVISVNLFADTSGTTVTKAGKKVLQFLIAVAGYPFSSLVGLLFLFLLARGYPLYVLFILTSITLLLMVLSIRNAYGLFWAGTSSLINLLLIYYDHGTGVFLASTFFTLIILVDSLVSTVILFVLSIKDPKKAGDAANLQKFTKIPAVIWSIIFMTFSGTIVYLSVKHYFPPLTNLIN